MSKKDHLDFDLSFLTHSKEPAKGKTKKVASLAQAVGIPPLNSIVNKYNWKKILIWGGVILFFGWAIISNDGSSSTSSRNSTYVPAANSDLTTGEGRTYRCSDYNYNRALALRPSTSQSDALDNRISGIKAERATVDVMYVDETNQASIDRYNAAIDSFNAKNNRLKTDLAAWDQSVETYNSFLNANCSPQ